ncbi:MAG: hypothetical protein QGG23_02865 [Candidatus Bathyarchaeota archaeon]|nr:hypothetical protein [Candidatus Bathyarchaeota archaeon]MDP7207688.1 hypothetical protein [Candidatus Bathyarchaeota archaeon]MDP7443531.1 hypothetical protein [Candidatus Bathyarchaeota archaeon]
MEDNFGQGRVTHARGRRRDIGIEIVGDFIRRTSISVPPGVIYMNPHRPSFEDSTRVYEKDR